jgi:F-type H+-transporting ATPase subunit delta
MEEIAQVYARSLFEVAKEQGKVDEIREELGQLSQALEESRDLSLFLFSPYFSTEEKKEGLHRVISDADESLVNFLELLLENHRMPALHRIRREYDDLWREENQLLPVQVTSAVDLVGGIVLRVGNSILDASIRNRLEQLRKQVARA